jgi:hypothetical protein
MACTHVQARRIAPAPKQRTGGRPQRGNRPSLAFESGTVKGLDGEFRQFPRGEYWGKRQ